MHKDLLLEIKEYIEETEVQNDGEWGWNRSLEKLIADAKMPKLYDKICELLKDS